MAPSFVTIDTADDLDFSPVSFGNATSNGAINGSSSGRTLLLAPPSIASHPDALTTVLASHPRSTTDLQMLDRLSAGFVSLPDATYDLVLVLSDADGSRTESTPLLLSDRNLFAKIAEALRPAGTLRGQGVNAAALIQDKAVTREAVLAGLVAGADGFTKPDYGAQGESVSLGLRFGKNKKTNVDDAVSLGSKPAAAVAPAPAVKSTPAGVGFIDLDDDFDDDELIDEDTLLTEEDLKRTVNMPPECAPKAGKRRRACKDCTCGLAERLAAEDATKRADADAKLQAIQKAKPVTLGLDDLTEVDFTVEGKTGSCGNCSLGDAFRCDGCPYIGMPSWKPGEQVRFDNLEVQL
ncbi:cytokine-induced anti-apoptosis inhibitor 1, Fe-S biogenesis-domain-containing protein [Plectosphaerella cucumerina]|uniref:Cytokine-induced anti-apoptosis inhibitor 1, Fe-S biogenesis-domain-containing protein n=1 Tax=Plectosphaerella cucumerina TaxID=40658 RepID=A0A8K0TU77_9PEZI|nr:cytokine-induced anti-apoptosis inhibitor 1, Fe-S biogenesis-domain-containing protein [Plectosphaerella cucumerina]